MKIAVIGSGSVGCLYGGRLQRQGHDVHFLMRRDLEAVRANGLTVHSCDGDFHIDTKAYGSSKEIGRADLVICALKTTSLDEAESLVGPCVGRDTKILALMNGLGVEEQFAKWFGGERVFGGLAFVCINRGRPGHVHHLGYGRLGIGHFYDDLEQARQLAAHFSQAGFDASVPPRLLQARWQKLVWNIPFSTLTVSAGGVSTKVLLDDPNLRRFVVHLMEETIAAAGADNAPIDSQSMIPKMLEDTAAMDHYKPSMLMDYLTKRPLEVESILGEPLRRAAGHGLAVPGIAAQYALVRHLDRLNRGLVDPLGEAEAHS